MSNEPELSEKAYWEMWLGDKEIYNISILVTDQLWGIDRN